MLAFLGIPFLCSCVGSEAAVLSCGWKSQILPPCGKHVPINRAEGETSQRQNDRHPHYKLQHKNTHPPSQPNIPRSDPVAPAPTRGPQSGSSNPSSPRAAVRRCFFLTARFVPLWTASVPVHCCVCYSQK